MSRRPIDLPPKVETPSVDPIEVARHSDGLETILVDGRKVEQFNDGVVLVYGLPQEQEALEAFVELHNNAQQSPDYDLGKFVLKNVIVSPAVTVSYKAPRHQSIAESTRELRRKLTIPNPTKKHASSEVLTSSAVGRYPPEHHWDSAHQAFGMAVDGEWDRVLGIAGNMEHQIDKYGHVINGTEDWYVTRPQPDYFAHMVRLIADEYGPQAYERYISTLEKNYNNYWMDGASNPDWIEGTSNTNKIAEFPKDGKAHAYGALVQLPDRLLLNRYHDDMKNKQGRVPARYESYAEDWATLQKAIEAAEKAKQRPLTELEREEVQDKVFGHLRAGAASGWDYSSRWLGDGKNLHTIKTGDILPIDLNSLLFYHEETMAIAYRSMAENNPSRRIEYERRAAFYQERANQRNEAMNKVCWNSRDGRYHDYDFVEQKQTPIISAASVYPLFVGASNGEQAIGGMETIRDHLLYPGGLASSTTFNSKEQWDSLNGWAPTNFAGARAPAVMAHLAAEGVIKVSQSAREWLFRTSEEVRDGYNWGNDAVMQQKGFFAEKIDVGNPGTPPIDGEYKCVEGLGMAAEADHYLRHYEPRDPKPHQNHLPIGKTAVSFWTPQGAMS